MKRFRGKRSKRELTIVLDLNDLDLDVESPPPTTPRTQLREEINWGKKMDEARAELEARFEARRRRLEAEARRRSLDNLRSKDRNKIKPRKPATRRPKHLPPEKKVRPETEVPLLETEVKPEDVPSGGSHIVRALKRIQFSMPGSARYKR